MKLDSRVATLVASLLISTAASAGAAPVPRSAPEPVPAVSNVPAARDVAFPGTIDLKIDATDVQRRVFRVTETVPVPAGQTDLILLLPEWLPGEHGKGGTMNLLADVHFQANGQELTWTRDPIESYAFHVAVPAGATQVTAKFVHTSPLQSNEGRITMTPDMLSLQWDKMSLYPAGYFVRQIPLAPTVTVPAGWQVYTALDGQQRAGDTLTWRKVDYEQLVDSPILAGRYARQFDIGHNVKLDAVADDAKDLALPPAGLARFRKLIEEGYAVHGAFHFDHYDFLVSLSDKLGGIGLEHQRSNESSLDPESFIKWKAKDWERNVIAHEFDHSWDGKYRRPADLWTPDYRTPMQDSLLWVYEGQNQFWGHVLAARSGIQAKDTVLGEIANSAGYYSVQAGREWRSVEDTTNDPIFEYRRPQPYDDLSRNEEYYNEGMLVWIEVDQIIRQGTKGAKGIDDFAKAFFGVRPGDIGQLTYTFDDVVGTLNGVYRYDWATFLKDRLYRPNQPPPVKGIEMAGYKLVWKDKPNPYAAGREKDDKSTSYTYSLGFALDKDGKVAGTLWNSPAFNAGVVTGAQVMAVNGKAYDPETLKTAITAAKTGKEPIQLLVKRGDRFMTVPVDYHGGLRYPWIEPAAAGEQPLDRLLAPRTGPLPPPPPDSDDDSN
ncbi:MAG: M61 family metallopeptidase [Croceibacterium sp.]